MSRNIFRWPVRLWLVLAVAAVGSLADVAEFTLHSPDIKGWAAAVAAAGLGCVAVFKATALTAIYAFCRKNPWLKAGAVALIAVFIALSLLNGCCWLFYGFGISMKLFKILMETNPAEAGEFLPELWDKLSGLATSAATWVSLCCFGALWVLLPRIPRRGLLLGAAFLSGLGVIYFAYVFSSTAIGRTGYSVLARSGRCVVKYVRDREIIREREAQKRPLPFPESLSSENRAARMVVVIGESASRDHLSLYGYPLPTSPFTDTISEGLYLFTDAVASSTSTAENMPRLTTLMPDEPGGKEWYEYPSLFQIFGRLGYRTYWLSNQEYSGRWSNLSSIISADADVVRYVGSADSEDHYISRYDDALMPEWGRAMAANDSLQLAFLHLMGSHFQYNRRFPSERKVIAAGDVMERNPRAWLDGGKAGIIANYDNSIRYTDSILSVLIKGVGEMQEPAVLLYLSDHGENVYDDRDFRGRDPRYVKVPFLIYANAAYRERNPKAAEEIAKARTRPFSTSELPQMLMHLSGTRYALYDSVRDPLSPAFRPRKRWVDGAEFHADIK